MARLILLGGPTGVGKSTALRHLEGRLPHSALVDADDVWRVSEDLAVEGTRANALDNVIGVMRGYFAVGCEVGIVSWVFARPQLYGPVIDGLKAYVDAVEQIYLVADADTLRRRLRARGDEHRIDYSLSRLALIEQLPFRKIDTTELSPSEAADALVRELHRT